MRSIRILTFSLLAITITLSSCRKDRYDMTPVEKTDFEQITVPSDFTWSAIKNNTLAVSIMVDGTITDKLDGSPLDLLDLGGNRIDRKTIMNGEVSFFFRLPASANSIKLYSPAVNKSFLIDAGESSFAFNISYESIPEMGADSDNDGVVDAFDDFPNDKDRAYNVMYPPAPNTSYILHNDIRYKNGGRSIVTQNFESGSRNIEREFCWQFYSTSINGGNNALTGQFSMRTGQMSSMTDTHDLLSPWIDFNGTGTIEFIHKLTSFNGASKHLDVILVSYPDLTETMIYSHDYNNTNSLQSVSIPIDFSGIHLIRWVFYGDGGNSRGLLDDIAIDGELAVDYDSNNGSGVCDAVDNNGGGGGNVGGGGTTIYPSGDNYLYQIFEDLWPNRGDYDFNDMVLASRFNFVRNAQNDIVSGQITTIVQAVGASIESGVGMEFFLANDNHTELSYMADIITFNGGGVAADPGVANGVKLFDNVRTWQNVYYSNTGGLGPDGTPDTVQFSFTIPAGVAQNIEVLPYIFRVDDNSWQVRTFGAPPTATANMAQFGSADDDSPINWNWAAGSSFSYPQTGSNAFYRTDNFHPWAVEFIAAEFKVPFEKTSVLVAYPQFQGWAESGGTTNANWYENPDNDHIYVPNF